MEKMDRTAFELKSKYALDVLDHKHQVSPLRFQIFNRKLFSKSGTMLQHDGAISQLVEYCNSTDIY